MFGGRGRGTWQQVGCPVCGPTCSPVRHAERELPPQDPDEGGGRGRERGSAARDWKLRVTAVKRAGAAVVIDLTSDGDDDGGSDGGDGGDGGRSVDVDGQIGGGRAGAASKRTRRDGAADALWECSRCTFRNDPARAQCAMECGGTRPGGPAAALASASASAANAEPTTSTVASTKPPAGTWACSACTCVNPKELSRCNACDTWRYARGH